MQLYFLLLISFLLHVFTFIMIKVLKDRITQPDIVLAKQAEQQKEMEELLAVYLLEIREENEKVVSMLQVKQSANEVKRDSSDAKDEEVTEEGAYQKVTQVKRPKEPRKPEVDYQPPTVNDYQDTIEKSLSAQVLSLHNQGETIESIARKLDCGKTEIELMIKFHQKNS